jgi:hypothetical protein
MLARTNLGRSVMPSTVEIMQQVGAPTIKDLKPAMVRRV